MAQIAEPRRFSDARLPAKSYDGSHLPWTKFRWNVLAPYRVRILDSVPDDRLPIEIMKNAASNESDSSRFDSQCAKFKEQVPLGRGFGPSPLFPPNLLPSLDPEAQIIHCMIPQCARDALPERAQGQQGSIYELPLPRPALTSGHALEAFNITERSELPTSLISCGTVVHYETGYVSPGVSAVAPFLTFERAKGSAEDELEATMNRCALNGSWCVRALQLMYNKAYQGFVIPQLPIAFSCAIDNTFAIINYHWIDHAEEYHMAPLRRFDFENDRALSSFQGFIEAIEKWAVNERLPQIKAGIEKLSLQLTTPPMTPDSQPEPIPYKNKAGSDAILKALKTTFTAVPWRMDEDDRTPMPQSALISPLTGQNRPAVFDFSNASISRSTAPNQLPLRHRKTSSISSEASIPSSPLSPGGSRRPPITSYSRPSVPVIRLPASPKDRQNSPSSPAPPQWQHQLMALSQEVQSLKKELQELKALSTPSTPGTIPNTPIVEEEAGLAPIPEESTSPVAAGKEVVTITTKAIASPITSMKQSTVVTVTEFTSDHPQPQDQQSPQHFADDHRPSSSSSSVSSGPSNPSSPTSQKSTVTPNTPVTHHPSHHHHHLGEQDRNTTPTAPSIDDIMKYIRSQLATTSFWKIAASVYLTIMVGRLVGSERHREALACLATP